MQETLIDRIIIKTDFNYCQLIIPSKKDFAASFFSGLGALIFFVAIIFTAISLVAHKFDDIFSIVWLLGASVGWLFISRVFLWNIIGKEVITIDNGLMTINRFWIFFYQPTTYELKLVKNLHTGFDDDSYENSKWNNSGLWGGRLKTEIKLGGTSVFWY